MNLEALQAEIRYWKRKDFDTINDFLKLYLTPSIFKSSNTIMQFKYNLISGETIITESHKRYGNRTYLEKYGEVYRLDNHTLNIVRKVR